VVANDYQNQDLYWALRGGGGGTFAVVVSVTLKTFPEPPVTIHNLNVSFPDITSFWSFTAAYLKALPSHSDAGAAGYWYLDPTGYILMNGKPTFISVYFFFNQTNSSAIDQLILPLYNLAESINGTTIRNLTAVIPQARYIYPQPGGSDSVGSNVLLGSRLYARSLLEQDDGPVRLATALANITTYYPTVIEGHLTAGGQVTRNADLDTAINPAWRKALGQIIIPVTWADNTTLAVQKEEADALTNIEVPQLVAVDPTMNAAYTNEANANEPDWQQVFWGVNYPRLLEVKSKWDPMGFFRCNRCVGSERWSSDGNCPAM
jgi:Berberine and berberine like